MRTTPRACALVLLLLTTASAAAMPSAEVDPRPSGREETCETQETHEESGGEGWWSLQHTETQTCTWENFGADAAAMNDDATLASASVSDGGAYSEGVEQSYSSSADNDSGESTWSWRFARGGSSGTTAKVAAGDVSAGARDGCEDAQDYRSSSEDAWSGQAHSGNSVDEDSYDYGCGTRVTWNDAELAAVGNSCTSSRERRGVVTGDGDDAEGSAAGTGASWCSDGATAAGLFAGYGTDCSSTSDSRWQASSDGEHVTWFMRSTDGETCDSGVFLRAGDYTYAFVGTRAVASRECLATYDGETFAEVCGNEQLYREARAETPVTTVTASLP